MTNVSKLVPKGQVCASPYSNSLYSDRISVQSVEGSRSPDHHHVQRPGWNSEKKKTGRRRTEKRRRRTEKKQKKKKKKNNTTTLNNNNNNNKLYIAV